ncbi:MAG: glycerate kinase [Bacteroidales bacterium]|jgi:glycerate kinase|nr:glycerate kinase [Bacteroidales bacterium]
MATRVLIAADKFKGSLTSSEAGRIIMEGLVSAWPLHMQEPEFDVIPFADGGDGSMKAFAELYDKTGGALQYIDCMASDALGDLHACSYVMDGDKRKAFIEMASICGLAGIPRNLRNPMVTTSFGLGQVIADAVLRGAEHIYIGIGGSASNDGGAGMLQALGVDFYFTGGHVPNNVKGYIAGGDLSELQSMDISGLVLNGKNISITAVCDVTNPLLGENGATYVFGPQKGGSEEMLFLLEKGMANYAAKSSEVFNEKDPSGAFCDFAGAGAAGGAGFALGKFLGGGMACGFDFFAGLSCLREKIEGADLVITGEGRFDRQSLMGKVTGQVMKLSGCSGKKKAIICGTYDPEAISMFERECSSGSPEVISLESLEPDLDKRMLMQESLLFGAARLLAGHLSNL